MRVLWAPWRLAYIEKPAPGAGCIFCEKPRIDAAAERRRSLVLAVTEHASVLMNLYPYASAHLMVAPRLHTADFASLDGATAAGVQALLQRAVRALAGAFSPAGFNIGMNLGRSAGAGIADHLHWHVVPRWEGDTNFMPLLAETRVISQHLEETYDRLLPLFEEVK
ncbi:MAG: HIT domain-containing protein [Deltaproteobacteria bacterium]|nr:HIT domain-containing protein [Deltaproteobacteria bacterium]